MLLLAEKGAFATNRRSNKQYSVLGCVSAFVADKWAVVAGRDWGLATNGSSAGTLTMPAQIVRVKDGQALSVLCDCRQAMGGLPPTGAQQAQQPQLGQGRYGNAPQLQNLQVASWVLIFSRV